LLELEEVVVPSLQEPLEALLPEVVQDLHLEALDQTAQSIQVAVAVEKVETTSHQEQVVQELLFFVTHRHLLLQLELD
jgi:hypothetical protein